MTDGLRKCSKCGQAKPLSEFYTDKRGNIPFSRCKACHKKASYKGPQPVDVTPERIKAFWENVTFPKRLSECWEWNRRKVVTGGYGKCNRMGNEQLAHRVSWILHRGPIPLGILVCHQCDNPSCVNPDHMFLGTNQDNSDDMVAKGRSAKGDNHGFRRHPELVPKGTTNGRAILKESDIPEIRRMLEAKVPLRKIANRYNVNWTTIRSIHRGQTWKHVP